jgi:hypothetical protein
LRLVAGTILKTIKGIEKQRGAAAVEFAVTLPFLLVLVFGMIEFGVMFYDKAVLTNASREAARAGITGLADPDIEQIAKDYCNINLSSFGGNDFDPDADPNDVISISTDGSNDLRVKLEFSYNLFFGSIFGFSSSKIEAETVMRME